MCILAFEDAHEVFSTTRSLNKYSNAFKPFQWLKDFYLYMLIAEKNKCIYYYLIYYQSILSSILNNVIWFVSMHVWENRKAGKKHLISTAS